MVIDHFHEFYRCYAFSVNPTETVPGNWVMINLEHQAEWVHEIDRELFIAVRL